MSESRDDEGHVGIDDLAKTCNVDALSRVVQVCALSPDDGVKRLELIERCERRRVCDRVYTEIG